MGQQNLDMLKNLTSQFQQPPQTFVEYDDEAIEGDNEEVILLEDIDNPREIGKVLKVGTQQKDHIPNNLKDDDEIIDYFLTNNTDWVICPYYL